MSGAPARPSDGFDPVWASRAALPRDGARETAALAGKRVLVTGAGGSIGSALCERLVTLDPASLIALDAAEGNLHELLLLLEAVPRKAPVVPVLADLRQGSALERCLASHAPDIVFHAAAFKHVPFLESQPWAVVENNVVATWRLLEAAARHGTGRLVALSTDKAVAPGSVMGRSKRLVELMVLGSSEAPPRPTAVRLGNVWGSRGSVVPRLRAQGLRGDALSVTDPEARRYFLSHEEAVTLLLSALWVGSGGDVLVPDLGRPLTMRELAGHVAGGRASRGRCA